MTLEADTPKPTGVKARLASLEADVEALKGRPPLVVNLDSITRVRSVGGILVMDDGSPDAATGAGKAPHSADTASDGTGQPEAPESAPEASTGEIQWGPEIEVNGRPAWLRDDDMTTGRKRQFSPPGDWPDPALNWKRAADVEHWNNVRAIRLPADSPIYTALDAGFVPWAGGDEAPGDWEGSDGFGRKNVLLRSGELGYGRTWDHFGETSDIIGYHRKPEATLAQATEVADLKIRLAEVEAERDELLKTAEQLEKMLGDVSAQATKNAVDLVRAQRTIRHQSEEIGKLHAKVGTYTVGQHAKAQWVLSDMYNSDAHNFGQMVTAIATALGMRKAEG